MPWLAALMPALGGAALPALTAAEGATAASLASAIPVGGSLTMGANGAATMASGATPMSAANIASGAVGQTGIGASPGATGPMQSSGGDKKAESGIPPTGPIDSPEFATLPSVVRQRPSFQSSDGTSQINEILKSIFG